MRNILSVGSDLRHSVRYACKAFNCVKISRSVKTVFWGGFAERSDSVVSFAAVGAARKSVFFEIFALTVYIRNVIHRFLN